MADRSNESLTRRVRSVLGAAGGGRHASEQMPSSLAEDDEELAARREQTRQNWLLASLLFIGGGVGAILPDALHTPSHPPTIYLLPLLAIVSGIVLLAIRRPHAPPVAAHHRDRRLDRDRVDGGFRRPALRHLLHVHRHLRGLRLPRSPLDRRPHRLRGAAFVRPALYADETARDSLLRGLILVPTLFIAGITVAFLRERLEASEERYRDLSERDPLTGVGNYRMLSVRVPQELRRHRRYGHSLALFVIDLDDFKRINDSYGHQRGDAVLQDVGLALMAGVRDHDIVVRQGGDEFAVVAPETDRLAADQLGDRLAAAVGRISADGNAVGCSSGAARFPEDADSLEGLLAVADARLRGAKGAKPSRHSRAEVEPVQLVPEHGVPQRSRRTRTPDRLPGAAASTA